MAAAKGNCFRRLSRRFTLHRNGRKRQNHVVVPEIAALLFRPSTVMPGLFDLVALSDPGLVPSIVAGAIPWPESRAGTQFPGGVRCSCNWGKQALLVPR